MKPFISVIVIAYNLQQYISECLHSIQEQTYKNIEIIVIDNGSVDSTGAICRKYAEGDSRIKVEHIANQGPARAREHGAFLARGDYIAFVDGDDWIEPTMYEAMVKALDDDTDIVVTGHYVVDQKGRHSAEIRPKPGVYTGDKLKSLIWEKLFYDQGRDEIRGYIWGKLYRTNIVLQNMKFNNHELFWGEDALINGACMLDAKKIVVIDFFAYNYRQHPKSLSKQYNPRLFDNICGLYNSLQLVFREKGQESLLREVHLYFMRMIIESVKVECACSGKTMKQAVRRIEEINSLPEVQFVWNTYFDEFCQAEKKRRVYAQLLKRKQYLRLWCKARLRRLFH